MARPERDPIEVTIEIAGDELVAGTLWIQQRRGELAVFRYSDDFLADPRSYDLDPNLPRAGGQIHSGDAGAMFRAFADGAPDRWGENLMRRAERDRALSLGLAPRTLTASDFLLGTRDDLRQGAIRFRTPGTGTYFATHTEAVPQIVSLARLLSASDRLLEGDTGDPDIADLIDAGSSLGGARPKAAVINEVGKLCLAKFPRASDEWNVPAWEVVTSTLGAACDITVAPIDLVTVDGRSVAVVERFDRVGSLRAGFASALTMIEAADHETHSYLDIAEVIELHSSSAGAGLAELFRRMVFSILVSNTDNHLRNHGFIRVGRGWELSPSYDVNPNPQTRGHFSTGIDEAGVSSDLEAVMDVAGYFRYSTDQAREVVLAIAEETSQWRRCARSIGIDRLDIGLMETAFDTEQRAAIRNFRPVVAPDFDPTPDPNTGAPGK